MPKKTRQYTLRNVPDSGDRALRRRAKESSSSLNRVALEALARGVDENLRPQRDFSEVVGSLSEREAKRLEEEIRLQHQIDPELWK